MLRSTSLGLFFLVVLAGSSLSYAGGEKPKVEDITGTVVAYDDVKAWVPCYEGECEGTLVVRVDNRTPGYILVNLTYRESRFPKELISMKRRWRLKLIRTLDSAESLDEFFIQVADARSAEKKCPIWKQIRGAEEEKLPFGDRLPSYSLVKDGFKLIKAQRVVLP